MITLSKGNHQLKLSGNSYKNIVTQIGASIAQVQDNWSGTIYVESENIENVYSSELGAFKMVNSPQGVLWI